MDKIKTNKILIIGNYASFYPRNYLIIRALRSKFEVTEKCLWREKRRGWKFFSYLFRFGRQYDYILVLKEGQPFVWSLILFKIFFHQPKIIFDAFISYYDTYVFDRQVISRYSLRAFYNYCLDFLSCWISDILLFDTQEHKEYFYKTFRIHQNKPGIILPVAVDLDLADKILAKEREEKLKDKFIVLFYGQYIPLQGVEYIIEAAKILSINKKILFLLIGSGQESAKIQNLFNKYQLDNITFLPRMPFEQIIAYTKMADVCLGIFGSSQKAQRVVPNKVLECAACAKIVITGKNSAMARYFEDKKNIVFCRLADAADLAQKIEWVYNNYDSLSSLGVSARKVVEDNFSLKTLERIIKQEF